MLKSVGIQTPDFFSLCDQYSQTEPGLFDREAWFFNAEEEPGSENECIENDVYWVFSYFTLWPALHECVVNVCKLAVSFNSKNDY